MMVFTNDWDWNRKIPSRDYHDLSLSGWPGWDKADGKEPYHILFSIVKGKDKSSRQIDIEFDDVSQGRFYSRDITESRLPFVNDGETYQALFVFQYKTDYDEFRKRFISK